MRFDEGTKVGNTEFLRENIYHYESSHFMRSCELRKRNNESWYDDGDRHDGGVHEIHVGDL